jgi:proline racemase
MTTVESHTAGEPTRVVLGGAPFVPGRSLRERKEALIAGGDRLRGLLAGEPRGHAATHAVLPLPPGDSEADVAVLIVSALGWLDMCGHALIGTVTSLLELGILPRKEPITELVVETLAGLIQVKAEVRGDRVRRVTFLGAPSWVLARDVRLLVPDIGQLRLDVVYGGLWYAVLDAAQVGVPLEPAQVPRLVSISHEIRGRLNRELPALVSHPLAPAQIPQLLYVAPAVSAGASGRNLATSSELGFDRSPCGTGSCARMALLHARGELPVGQRFVHESILGTCFDGEIVEVLNGPGGPSIRPSISGSAFITGFSQLVVDPEDPLGEGFFIPAAAG